MNHPEKNEELFQRAILELTFEPLPDQIKVLKDMALFASEGNPEDIFVLNGYAGTGKTSLVGALIKAMDRLKMKVIILAPTGRGAQVASEMSSHKSSTIHRRLYRPDLNDRSGRRYVLSTNESRDTLFVVDEASLISDGGNSRDTTLLAQLIRYVYSAPGCRILLMGDEAQLPPVGQEKSTSMRSERLRQFGLNPIYHTLDVPMRQGKTGGIIHNATLVRTLLMMPQYDTGPRLEIAGFDDVTTVNSIDLPDMLEKSYATVGKEETLIITRANWRANEYNTVIRNRVFYAESPIERGDRLVITKNDYYWGKRNKAGSLIANGDMAEVKWVGRNEKAYGRWFTEVELEFTDGRRVTAMLMLRSLVSEGPSIPRSEMEHFYNIVLSQEKEGGMTERIMAALENPYYNALQAKYAYCVTCHKAQGGEWKHVYIDMTGIDAAAVGPDFYRWLYTAITRARERVIFINPTIPIDPDMGIDNSQD